ncbi:MAG: flagellar biosynthesis protein FlhA [Bacillus thermozeamaize]|uniref:Flagellar biosynthesis protein FlhA n=1 Tax=Bacillus thermozeamaize TaxID=230954 RepID=A0A1Y3PT96_9BACI|nr:MAG: flagellar biosynthesis protein FlhA [Bacillus thermozeamaize]
MKFKDSAVLVFIVLIVIMLVIPLPTLLLDFLIIINMTLALAILMVAMNTREALQFSIFPTLLLVATLFRLALNVSTTRAILSQGYGGRVIEAFGHFVIGGNPVVGFIIFLILVLIQFIVITKGAERVSEVAARFTLDAMPGKQMSIDADLNAGLITEAEARQRRKQIEAEADFYGAMDGASKFVKGDAIAGMIIVAVNIVGGFVIGMLMMGLSFGESLHRFTLLSVGDGLVAQIPALLISTATGIVVTRASSESNLGEEITSQLTAYPRSLYIVAGVIALLGLLTPIGIHSTWPVAALVAFAAWRMQQSKAPDAPSTEESAVEEGAQELRRTENVYQLLYTDPVEFEFGYGLIPLADSKQGGDLLDRVVMIRRQLAAEMGFVLPVVRIRDNIQLHPNEYQVKIRGTRVASGEVMLDHYLVMGPEEQLQQIPGTETKDPAFGIPARWVPQAQREEAELAGLTVVDPPSVIATHLTEVFKKHAHELLSRQETQALIDHLKEQQPALVEELVPKHLSVGGVQKVLANLLREKVSIRNLALIFEALADHASYTQDPDLLTEFVRQALSRQITQQYCPDDGILRVLTFSPTLEKRLADSIHRKESGTQLVLDPATSQQLLQRLSEQIARLAQGGWQPLLLTSPALRPYVRRYLEKWLPDVPVLSYNELEPDVQVQSVGVVQL